MSPGGQGVNQFLTNVVFSFLFFVVVVVVVVFFDISKYWNIPLRVLNRSVTI